MFIVNNPIIKDLHYFASPSDAKGFELYSGLINRYIGYLTFALNYRMHGLSVTGYHIVNIAIHIANSILVYLLVLLTFNTPFFIKKVKSVNPSRLAIRDSRSLIAFFSAALFAAHPLQTEAVTYVFQRFASLAAFFYLLSLTAYIKSRLMVIGDGLNGNGKYRHLFYYGISFISAVLAMKTKENAFTLPLVITLYEFCFFKDSMKKRACYLAPILLTLTIIPLTLMSLTGTHQLDPGSYGAKVFPQNEYLFTQFRVIVTYLRLLFFPVNQNIFYDYPVFKSFFVLPVVLSFVFLALLLGIGVYMIRGDRQGAIGNEDDSLFTIHDSQPLRLMGFGILWFFITLSVESSIIPIPMIINEYRVYLPSVGVIICAVTVVFLLKEKLRSLMAGRIVLTMLVLAIGVLAITTFQRNEVWGDKIRLWEDTVKKSPAKESVHNNLGNDYKAQNMPDKAMEQFLIAIKLNPDYVEAHYNLGIIYQARNMPDKAMDELKIAINLNPSDAKAHYNLGVFYQTHNMPDKAMEQFLIVIKLKPDYAEAHNNLGILYQARNMPNKVIEQFLIAIKLKPDYAEAHYNLGILYQAGNMLDKAMEQFLIAVKLKPDYAEAHYNLCGIYQAFNMPDKAMDELQIAIKLKPDNAEAHYNLGILYQAGNMLDKAMEQFLIAVKLKPDYAEAHYNLCGIYQAFNMPDKAVDELQIAIKLKPDNEEAHYNLGVFYQARNMPDKAAEQYLTAIRLNADDAEAHHNLGIIYQDRKMYDKAIEQYLTAIRLKPDYADAHLNLGSTYYRTGQMENARRELTEGLRIKPDEPKARQLLKAITSH